MTLADAAATVLEAANDAPLDCHQIAERAIREGLIKPKSEEPWTYVRAAIRKDNKSREPRGLAPRFETVSPGKYRLNQ